jgi:NNP family nitrate/nitrite transporter-like MFS transporter
MTSTRTYSRVADAGQRIRGLGSFRGRYKTLHATWFAFFLTFVVWFGYAPFAGTIAHQFGLTKQQSITLGLVNVALTVPARILIGMALDHWGPRRVYGSILMFAAIPCLAFATAQSFTMLLVSRLALSVVGAGFVVGIRIISEWFPPKEVGLAEGIYGGWGNFGAAAAAFVLPIVAGFVAGPDGWRWAIGGTGVVAAIYGLVYLRLVQDTPSGVRFDRPRRKGALEVSTRGAVLGLIALMIPTSAVLGLIAWRIFEVDVLSPTGLVVALAGVAVLIALQTTQVIRVNRPALRNEVPAEDHYPFRSVAVLAAAYLCCFGSELAVVSMLPVFFADTWGLSPAAAGIAASGFAFMNLVARPAGGMMSDLLGSRKRTLSILLGLMAAGYVLLASMGRAWPWVLAVAACMTCSFFVQGSSGAVFAIVPLVKKRVSGQVAGIAGAYGNVGALLFLTALLYVSPSVFFLIIAGASVVGTVATSFLVEPANSFHHELVVEADVITITGASADAEAALEPSLA